MRALALAAALALGALCSRAAAQTALPGFSAPVASAPAVNQQPQTPQLPPPNPLGGAGAHPGLGNVVDLNRGGPWVIGEVLFFSNGQLSTDYSLRDRVRAARGGLYTRNDIFADVDSLMATQKFVSVTPSLFEIPSSPVPPELAGIAISTSEVRLVFDTIPKPVVVSTAAAKPRMPPAALSGIILTPTAYRGLAVNNAPGLGLDFNAVYIIGRLYGKNSYPQAPDRTNYIDRVGVWLLGADGKMQIQSETAWRPAMAVGAQGSFMFRDSPQPNVNPGNTPTVTVNASQKSTQLLSDAYFVASKKFGPIRTSAGFMQGSMGRAVMQFSDLLSPDALHYYAGNPTFPQDYARTMPFVSILSVPKPQYPLAVEVVKLNGAPANPILFDFKVGYFLHLNFDLGYLKFQNGWDLLGLLQFRFNEFPRR